MPIFSEALRRNRRVGGRPVSATVSSGFSALQRRRRSYDKDSRRASATCLQARLLDVGAVPVVLGAVLPVAPRPPIGPAPALGLRAVAGLLGEGPPLAHRDGVDAQVEGAGDLHLVPRALVGPPPL